jgi:hypothetical protein
MREGLKGIVSKRRDKPFVSGARVESRERSSIFGPAPSAGKPIGSVLVFLFWTGGPGGSLSRHFARTHRRWLVRRCHFSLVYFGPKFLDISPELVGS